MDDRPWALDTTSFTHLCRAGHATLFERLAPGGIVVVPLEVCQEVDDGRAKYPGIPDPAAASWVNQIVLDDDENLTLLGIKAQMGGIGTKHLGECAVIASSKHRGFVAILDERDAIGQAERLSVPWHDTIWIVIHAYKSAGIVDRDGAEAIIDDLLDTGMYLPLRSGSELFAWAYKEGLLP